MRRGTTKQSRPALPPDTRLLSRTDFDALVKHRSHGRCVLCDAPAVDAHNVLDHKLYQDGGYYLCNGAAVCSACSYGHLDHHRIR